MIVEEIVGLDGGFAGRVEGDGDGEEGDGGIVVGVARSSRVSGWWSLGAGASGEEKNGGGGQEYAEE